MRSFGPAAFVIAGPTLLGAGNIFDTALVPEASSDAKRNLDACTLAAKRRKAIVRRCTTRACGLGPARRFV